ncbi:MAG TPA: hypothetical protein VE225_09370 [Rubrobacteraceae bacterium]|nr:hypothetical protein [Rubrobacteraceae bacterium]
MMVKACLSGKRKSHEHPALPLSSEKLARDTRRAVEVWAGALHFHPRLSRWLGGAAHGGRRGDGGGGASAWPGVPLGVSMEAWLEGNPRWRVKVVGAWGSPPYEGRPDFASINRSEAGVKFCAGLGAGIGVEATLCSMEDAQVLLEAGR